MKLLAIIILAVLVAVGCSDTNSDDTLNRCLEDMINETNVVEKQYQDGELDSVDETFLDQNGIQASVIIAEYRVRARDEDCDEAFGPVEGVEVG